MKNVKFALLTAVVIAGMTACGQPTKVPAIEEEPQVAADAVKYIFEGKEVSVQELDALEAKYGKLFLLDQGGSWAVYTNETDLKAAQDSTVDAAFLCLFRDKTTIYDLIGYKGAKLDISKGSSFSDLRTISQSGGSNWNNDINSFKGACGVYTRLYRGYNFSGSVFLSKGQEISNLGGWNNRISSLKVDF